MRLLTLFALCFIAVPALACEGFQNSMSALEHSMGIEVPDTRAASNSREIEFHGEKLTVIARNVVGQSAASALGVYQFKDGQWQLIKSITASSAAAITYKQSNDQIVFYPINSRLALLTLTARDLV